LAARQIQLRAARLKGISSRSPAMKYAEKTHLIFQKIA
jgi:hypothetical protein